MPKEWIDESCSEEEAKEYIKNQFTPTKQIVFRPEIYGKLIDIKINRDNICFIILQRYSNDINILNRMKEAFKNREVSLIFDLRV